MTELNPRLSGALSDRYRIERELGQGGMATVFLAEDLKHKRKVALKVLKPELAAVLGGERFVQEITTTASLQHPHILPLFDSGTAEGFLYYVMPFIEGETLRDKLNRETQLGVDEAVRIAREVADALAYAHGKGVIHRDIKPENILIQNGRPMVADFGIALAVSAAAGGRMTETGLSLGTPHYMSPEQATADKEISARSDVYSLASVLYEALAGQPPHVGGSAQQVIMKIIAEPVEPVTRYRKSVPPNVASALTQALEKLPADRFESAKAFSDALADSHFTTRGTATAGAVTARPQRTAISGLAAALGAMTILAGWALTRPEPPSQIHRYALSLSGPQEPNPFGYVVISADGSRIVYLGRSPRSPGLAQLWVKSRDSEQASLLAGTEASTSVAISPDGQSIAFIAGKFLRTMPITGGAPAMIVEGISNVQGSVAWLDDNSLVYVASNQRQLMRIPSGGTGSPVWSSTDSLIVSSLTPLPDGRGVLFQACPAPCGRASLWVLDLRSSTARELVPHARVGYYLPSGHLVYVDGPTTVALAARFDVNSLQLRGAGTPVFDSVAFDGGIMPYFTTSAAGTVVMRRGASTTAGDFELVWVDRDGRETAVDSTFKFRVTQTAGNFAWSLSPDGGRLAIGRNTSEGDDIWIKSLPRGPARRLTFGTESEARPRWTKDGLAITYVGDRGIVMRRADGTGSDSLVWKGTADEAAISPDGNWLVLRKGATSASAGGRDIFGVRLGGTDTALVPLVVTRYDESAFAVSPTGQWIAYHSEETGQTEVFVRPFPNTNDVKEQVSLGGGRAPVWSRDGRELFYLRADNTMMTVPVAPGTAWRPSEPKALFRLSDPLTLLAPSWYAPWDIAPDGRFIFARSIGRSQDDSAPLIVIENWLEELKQKVPR